MSEETLTSAQLIALNLVYGPFRDAGSWPEYRYLDKMLDRNGLDARELLPSLPPSLMRPDPARPNFFPQSHDQVSLTIAGVAHCEGGETDVSLFMRALRCFVALEEEFTPRPTGGEVLKAGSKDLRQLGMTLAEIARVYEWMTREVGILGSGGGSAEEWSFELNTEVRRFRGVQSFEDYLERRIIPPPYPGFPADAVFETVAPLIDALEKHLAPQDLVVRLWWRIREDPLLTAIVGGVAATLMAGLIVALVLAALHAL